MMFSRKLLLVAVFVFTLVADIKATPSSKSIPYHGYMNGQQAGVYRPTVTIAQHSTAPALHWPQGVCDPCATNQKYSHFSPPTTYGALPNRDLCYDPTTLKHQPVIGYPGYLVYKCAKDPSTTEDPQWDPEYPGWDPEDPGYDPEDPEWDSEDPEWDSGGDPNDPDDSDSSFTDMMSSMAQQVMSMAQNPAMGTLGNFLTGNNPIQGLGAGSQLTDPGVASFASTTGNTLSNTGPEAADFASTTGNTISDTGSEAADFAGTTGNTISNSGPEAAEFSSTTDSATPQAQSEAGPTVTDFAASENNDIGQGIAQTQTSSEHIVCSQGLTDTDTLGIWEFAMDKDKYLGDNSPQKSAPTLDLSNIIPVQQSDLKLDQLDNKTKSQFSYIIFVEDDDKSLNKNAELCLKSSIRKNMNPSVDIHSSKRTNQESNSKVPLQILFKSNMSKGGVQFPNNNEKTYSCIRPNIPISRDVSVCKAIRDSAALFNRTQNINSNPFLILTPKNLTRSSLTNTNAETYLTSKEMENLYENAVSKDQSWRVLFLPDYKMSEEQIQNIVEMISLDISKKEGRYCQELVLIPLDLTNNSVENSSNEISISSDTDADKESRYGKDWNPLLYSDSGEIHPEQESSETTFSTTSTDSGTTGVTNLTISNPLTCKTPTTKTNLCEPVQPIPIPPYPEKTIQCLTSSYENLSLNVSSTEASVVDKSNTTDNQNQELKKEDQNCSMQSKNKTHHTEIFIPCFISIGHGSDAFGKKICEMQENGCITKLLPQHYMYKSKDQDIKDNHGGVISTNSQCFQSPTYVPCSREGIAHPIPSGIPYQTFQPVDNIATSGSLKMNSSQYSQQSIWSSVHFENKDTPVTDKGKASFIGITTYPHRNNLESSSTVKDCACDKKSDIQTNSGGIIPTSSVFFQPPPSPPYFRKGMVHPVSSGSSYQTITAPKVDPVNLIPLSGSPGMNNPQSIWDSVNFQKETPDFDGGNPSFVEETTYPDQIMSGSSETRQECVADRTTDDKHDSSFNHITYPITLDQITKYYHNRENCEEVEPILPSCECLEKAGNSASNNTDKYGLVDEKKGADQFGTVNLNRDETVQNDWKINNSGISLETHQFEHSGASRSTLDNIKKNANNNHHIVVGKSYISHPITGTTTLDAIRKNAKINEFSGAEGIESPLSKNTQEYGVKPHQESENIKSSDPSDGSNKLKKNDKYYKDRAMCTPETKLEIPKCPSSKVFTVEVDNTKPLNGTCPCSSNLLNMVWDGNVNNTNSKDHSCLCRLWSMHQQKKSPAEDTKPDSYINETCTSSEKTTPQATAGYDIIPRDKCGEPDKYTAPLDITQISTAWDTMQSTDYSLECDKNINTNTEINNSSKLPINGNCFCNSGSEIGQKRDGSQRNGEYDWKINIDKAPLSSVYKKMELPNVCLPSNNTNFEIPILDVVKKCNADRKKPEYIEIATYPHQNIPGGSMVPQGCDADKNKDDKHDSSIDQIRYPITSDQITEFQEPVLPPCRCLGNAGDSATNNTGKYGLADEKKGADQSGIIVTLNKDNPVSNNQKPNISGISLEAHQFEHSGANRSELDNIKKNANNNHHIVVGKSYISHPITGTTTLDAIRKNAKINEFSGAVRIESPLSKNTQEYDVKPYQDNKNIKLYIDSSDGSKDTGGIESPLSQTTQECDVKPYQESQTIKPFDLIDGRKKLINNDEDYKEQAMCIPETRPEIPKCPNDHAEPVECENRGNIPVPIPPTIDHYCHSSHEHSKTTLTPVIQALPIHHKIPRPQICSSTEEHTKNTEIPISKCNGQAFPSHQHIPVPIKDSIHYHLCNTTIVIPIVPKPPTQEFQTTPKTHVPITCPTTNVPVNSVEIVEKPKPITETQDWRKNIAESQTKIQNVSQNIEIPNVLKAVLDENCICKLKAILERQRTSNGQTNHTVDKVMQRPYGTSTFPTSKHDSILTNCVPTDEQPRTNEIIPQSVLQTKNDWNIDNNSQVNNGSCRGDMKPTTDMDCEKCRERRKELLAKILKEVFVNNLDLLYEDKKPCKPLSGIF